MENKFEKAINSNELEKFIIGKGKYFVLDREIGMHWPLESYKLYVEPYIKSQCLGEKIWKKIIKSFLESNDKNIFLDNLVGYLIPYYSIKESASRVESTPIEFIELVVDFLNFNHDNLKNDKRGTGVEWNSKNGLLDGITQNLQIIKERGGPNFMKK